MNKTKSFAKMLVALLVAMFAFTCFASSTGKCIL